MKEPVYGWFQQFLLVPNAHLGVEWVFALGELAHCARALARPSGTFQALRYTADWGIALWSALTLLYDQPLFHCRATWLWDQESDTCADLDEAPRHCKTELQWP